MNLTIRVFGLELLSIEASTEDDEAEDAARDLSGGTTGSTPITFTASPGDARWERGADYGAGEPEDRTRGRR